MSDIFGGNEIWFTRRFLQENQTIESQFVPSMDQRQSLKEFSFRFNHRTNSKEEDLFISSH